METIFYFLLLAGTFFLMMRFGCGSHVTGHGHAHRKINDHNPSGQCRTTPETATDPVCGMTVQTRTARSAVHDGRIFYFCSNDCRERFEADPETYRRGTPAVSTEKEHVND
jgi:YHS domain-containing protein